MEEKKLIFNNPFNLNINIQAPKKTIQEVQKVAQQELAEMSVNPFLNYLDENDKVFSGEVSNEIRKYQAQLYTLGQTMRNSQPRTTFRADI